MQRAQYLGGVTGTPTVYINGSRKSANGSGWDTYIDGLLAESAGLTVTATVGYTADSIVLNYTVARRMGSQVTSASVYALLTEDITYSGRNGISDHKNALRKLFTPVAGTPLSFDDNGIANGRETVVRSSGWDVTKLHGIISVQSPLTKASLQAMQVNVEMATSVEDEANVDANTVSRYSVYSLAGNVISTGVITTVETFDPDNFIPRDVPSGLYLVRVSRGTKSNVYPVALTR